MSGAGESWKKQSKNQEWKVNTSYHANQLAYNHNQFIFLNILNVLSNKSFNYHNQFININIRLNGFIHNVWHGNEWHNNWL